VMMDRDNITRTGARAPGVERLYRLHGGGNGRYATSTQSEKLWRGAATAKDGRKPQGKAPSDKPALEPYWGKPTVRNLRGGDGNVGIIRSPVRAIVLPDPLQKQVARDEPAFAELNFV